MSGKPHPIADRFWKKVDKSGDCWLWMAGKDAGGYGMFNSETRREGAHRTSYRLAFGEIPFGFYVCHHCDTPPCVRPDHLFLGTPKNNSEDRDRKGRMKPNKQSPGTDRVRVVFRFLDSDHHELVKSAAKRAGLSLNSWMVQATLAQARKELGIK